MRYMEVNRIAGCRRSFLINRIGSPPAVRLTDCDWFYAVRMFYYPVHPLGTIASTKLGIETEIIIDLLTQDVVNVHRGDVIKIN